MPILCHFRKHFLIKSGKDVIYSDRTMHWFENVRLIREPWSLDNKEYIAMDNAINIQQEDELFGEDWLESYLTNTIVGEEYEKLDVQDVTSPQKYLNIAQQCELETVLEKYTKLFDGTLGVYLHKKFHIEVEENAQPKHSQPYAVPNIHLEPLKEELKHLVRIVMLSKTGASEWASPTFIIPKKDG